ncbi:MAG TPA: sensor domain-containing diguanylate cyclase [Baekduia sp.]|jgi:diguanylate cyclase (GGDEF)-like protein|nr:sensor domain-containing diguanylate cyclase [Baekduia sp.]
MQQGDATRFTRGLESIIDAAASILAEGSLESTFDEMARALDAIVPFTSLAVYSAEEHAEVLLPVFAVGRYVRETLAAQPPIDASIAGRVVRTRMLVHLEPSSPRGGIYAVPGTPQDEPEALVCTPLIAGARVIGTLNVWREGLVATFAAEEVQLIQRFATLAALAFDNARQRERLSAQARTDELTGLFNRRHFHERLGAELSRARRAGEPVALLLLDVDDFKAVNDGHGHPVGDAVLCGFADVLRREVRGADVVCRTGGEEFAVILPATAQDEAVTIAHRLVACVRAAGLGPEGGLTTSVGLAFAPGEGDTVATLFRAADDRLLAAKTQGKDRAVTGR